MVELIIITDWTIHPNKRLTEYLEKYWWRLVGEVKSKVEKQQKKVQGAITEWPQFWGHRRPLGDKQ